MTAGRVVLYFLFPKIFAEEGVLSSRGVALSSNMVMYRPVASISHLVRIFLMVCICLLLNPMAFGVVWATGS